VDKEEFQAWKDSPATRWVLAALQKDREAQQEGHKDYLLRLSAGATAGEWSSQQARSAYLLGRCDQIDILLGLTFEELADGE
jgi:hypothetical protein